MIDRRIFVAGAIAAAGPAQPGFAQTARTPGKIGYIHPVTISPDHNTYLILQTAWRKFGYVEGETVLARSAQGDMQRLPALVAELIAHGAGVLIVVGADAVRAAARATSAMPIVAIDMETDPVRTGLVANFAKPGGNVTGLFLDFPSIATKWIELLREAVPGLQRIAFVWQPSMGREQLDLALNAARALTIDTVVVELDILRDFDTQLAPLAGGKRTGIVQLTFPGISAVVGAYSTAAIRNGLPIITHLKAATKGGLFMSYGASQEAYYPRAIEMADKVLRGEKPGNIPIERPIKFELVVNLKTAAALGLTISPAFLIRADEVIE